MLLQLNLKLIIQTQETHLNPPLEQMATSKVQVFILTFVSCMSIHALRTTYSFSKHFLNQALEVEKSLIGSVDSMLLLSLGIGHFSHVLYPLKHRVKGLWIATLLCALDYMLIPLAIETLHIRSFLLLFILMAINGYLQSYAWPNLLMIIDQKIDQKKNETLLGFWICNTNVGNLVGYFICYQFIIAYEFHWEVGMYIAGLFVAICSILIWLRVQDKCTAQQIKIPEKNRQELWEHIKITTAAKKNRVVFIVLAFSFINSVIYAIMLWFQIYFRDIGLVEYQTWIPVTYDSASIVGSLTLGYVLTRFQSKGKILAGLILVLGIFFFILKYMELTIFAYFVLIAEVGACLGGSFNTMAGFITIESTKVVPQKYRNQCLGFFSALNMSAANLTTAFTQILIGYIAQKDESIILIFLMYSFITLLCFFIVMGLLCFFLAIKAQLTIGSDQSLARKSSHEDTYANLKKYLDENTIKEILQKKELFQVKSKEKQKQNQKSQ